MSLAARVVPFAAVLLAAAACETPPAGGASSSQARAALAQSTPDALWDDAHGRPKWVTGRFDVKGATVEDAARTFLAAHAAEYHLDHPGLALDVGAVKQGRAGTYVRFQQHERGVPVFDAEVIVLVSGRAGAWQVRAVNLAHEERAAAAVEAGDVGEARALALALAAVQAEAPFTFEPRARKGIFTRGAAPVFAWRVRVSTDTPAHAWEVLVDAASGEVLETRDRLWFVNGTAMVFDPNPVATAGNTSLRDNGDATSAVLDSARYSVTLPRLDGSGYTRGTWVDARTRQSSSRVSSPTNDFSFNRSQSPSFEQANAYYHLDRVQNRIQQDLGFTNVNNRVQVALVDGQNADNSFFDPNSRNINYGRGGVDDAEDADIVVHEYGHAVQEDQVAGFGRGDEGAMGEGFGDYLAASMLDTLGQQESRTTLGSPTCVGDWDAVAYVNTPPICLRTTDSKKHYPEAEVGEVHDDGEMWAAALWGLRTQLGADIADTLVLEGHFLLSNNETFEAASTALATADTNVYLGAHRDTVYRRMIQQGLSRHLTTATAGSVITSVPLSVDPKHDVNGNYFNDSDDTQTVVLPGATLFAVHFASVSTELDSQCLAGACDNVYLTNGDGDLFEVLNGTKTDVTSAPIAGDTVNIRLVADPSVNRPGYHVDRIDILGGAYDGGVIYDAGVPPVVDAGQPDAGTDAGTDAGVADAGAPDAGELDAGAPDAGPTSDAGTATDGGETATLPAVSPDIGKVAQKATGCGCTTGFDASGFGTLLLALGALARQRRKERSRSRSRSRARLFTCARALVLRDSSSRPSRRCAGPPPLR